MDYKKALTAEGEEALSMLEAMSLRELNVLQVVLLRELYITTRASTIPIRLDLSKPVDPEAETPAEMEEALKSCNSPGCGKCANRRKKLAELRAIQ